MDEPPAPAPEPAGRRPAFYAAGAGGWRDWWTLLHPPYTAWNLAYVVIGSCIAPRVDVTVLVGALLAFFGAVGLAAHALDELHGRPLRTAIPSGALVATAAVGLGGAVVLGALGIATTGWPIVPFLVVGPCLVVLYNFELLGGVVHNDVGFAASWGAFPLLTGYVSQAGSVDGAAVLAALAALALSAAQRALSSPARCLRRRAVAVTGAVRMADGEVVDVDHATLLAPLERALRAMAAGVVLLAAGLAVARLA